MPSLDLSHVGPIIENAKSLLHLTFGVTAPHIRRQVNSIAHRLAFFAIHASGKCTWFDHPRIIVYDLLEEYRLYCTSNLLAFNEIQNVVV